MIPCHCSVIESAEAAKLAVSPLSTSLLRVSAPKYRSVPPERLSKMPTELTVSQLAVAVGKVTGAVFSVTPERLGAPNVTATRVYEPPETSVPAVPGVGADVKRAAYTVAGLGSAVARRRWLRTLMSVV